MREILHRTALSILLGTGAAYAFSRFKIPIKDDLLFFILSTRMMPPIAVAIPIYLMYREVGLSDTKLGMILATVDDDTLLRTMFYLWERLKLVVEPTGALGAAAACGPDETEQR